MLYTHQLIRTKYQLLLYVWFKKYFILFYVPLVEQELPTLPEHLSSRPIFSGVRVTRSLVLCSFVDRCWSFCTFYLGHYVVCSSLIYGFWLPPFGIFNSFYNLTQTVGILKQVQNSSPRIENIYYWQQSVPSLAVIVHSTNKVSHENKLYNAEYILFNQLFHIW
jgi:hypothetical protein